MAGSSGLTQEQQQVRREFKAQVDGMTVEEARAMCVRMASCMETFTVEAMMGRKPWEQVEGWDMCKERHAQKGAKQREDHS